MARPRTPSDAVAQRRREIVLAARSVFSTSGYHNSQIADIAAALKIGHGTVYRYFKDKRDLFVAVLEDVVTETALAVAFDAPDAESLEEYLEQMDRIGSRLHELLIANEHLYRLLFEQAPAVDQAIADDVQQARDAFASITEAYITNGQQKGFLRRDIDANAAAHMLNAMTFESARLVLRATDRQLASKTWRVTVPRIFVQGMSSNPLGKGK